MIRGVIAMLVLSQVTSPPDTRAGVKNIVLDRPVVRLTLPIPGMAKLITASPGRTVTAELSLEGLQSQAPPGTSARTRIDIYASTTTADRLHVGGFDSIADRARFDVSAILKSLVTSPSVNSVTLTFQEESAAQNGGRRWRGTISIAVLELSVRRSDPR